MLGPFFFLADNIAAGFIDSFSEEKRTMVLNLR